MKKYLLLVAFCINTLLAGAQIQWFNPLKEGFPVVQGRAWTQQNKDNYHRLPLSAEQKVRKPLWDLSRQSAGLYISFYSDAPSITIKYTVKGTQAMYHMPATGVSGIDLYSTDCNGKQLWCAAQFRFGDTITYSYNDLSYHNTLKQGNEYQLFLPLYNEVNTLEIGIPTNYSLEFVPIPTEKPIVVYGTSIAQGACATRPGMAWTNIVQRETGSPVINLGFSGNGQLEQELFDLLVQTDAQLYIIDCMPNMIGDRLNQIVSRTVQGVKTIRKTSNALILLVEHCGYRGGTSSDRKKEDYTLSNIELQKAYKQLKDEGVANLHYLAHDEIGLSIDSQVDGVHANDLGMLQYADAYVKKINEILIRPEFSIPTLMACKQRREAPHYEWNVRHEAVLAQNRQSPPQIVMIGNSITHFWGGEPKGYKRAAPKVWDDLFAGKKVTNMGFGWDRVENVLWRIYHGELSGYNANKVFLMIGTNNLEYNTNQEIADGIAGLADVIRQYQPNAKLYIVKIYPRRKGEERIAALNKLIEQSVGSNPSVKVIDIAGGLFSQKETGKIDESCFSDGLHPNEKGYTAIAKQLKQYVNE